MNWTQVGAELLSGFVVAPILLTQLGASSYGIWVALNSVTLLLSLTDFGLRNTYHRLVCRHTLTAGQQQGLDRLTMLVLLGNALLCLLAHTAVGYGFAHLFPKAAASFDRDAFTALLLLALSHPLSFLISLYGTHLAANGRNAENIMIVLMTFLARLPFTVLAVFHFGTLASLACVNLLFGVIAVACFAWRARSMLSPIVALLRKVESPPLDLLFRENMYSFVSRSITTVNWEIPTYLALWLLGPEAVAMLSFCLVLVGSGRKLVDAVSVNLFPYLMRAAGENNRTMLVRYCRVFADYMHSVGALLFLGIAVYGGSFLERWLGSVQPDVVQALGIMSIGAYIGYLSIVARNMLEGLVRLREALTIAVTELVLNLALALAVWVSHPATLVPIAIVFAVPRALVTFRWLTASSRAAGLGRWELARLAFSKSPGWLVVFGILMAVHRLMPPVNWFAFAASVLAATAACVTLFGLAAFWLRWNRT